MRGGRFQQKTSEDGGGSLRNAEVLFETRSVAEIRQVEVRTREEIEEKKEELRQLVGASYRDLIESADSILKMRKFSEAVTSNLGEMEGAFSRLEKSISTVSVTRETQDVRARRERLYAISSRVKYLVDTPEKIWGCLDEHMYLEAAERYLRAREVHKLLIAAGGGVGDAVGTVDGDTEGGRKAVEGGGGGEGELLSSFPLLRHQWMLVESFRNQIRQKSRDRVQDRGLTVGDYAVALSAVAVIEGNLSSGEVFSLFLDSQRSGLRAQLRSSSSPPSSSSSSSSSSPSSAAPAAWESVAQAFAAAAALIQTSLCHVGELFLEVSPAKPALLFSTALTSAPPSQLFGGIPQPEREVELWKGYRERLESTLTPLSGKIVAESCYRWLSACAEDIAVEGRALIGKIRKGRELAEMEKWVREEISKPEAMEESKEWLAAAFGSAGPDVFASPWSSVCELVVKGPVDLWQVLFDSIVVERAKAIISASFEELSLAKKVDEVLVGIEPPRRRRMEGSAVSGRRGRRRERGGGGMRSGGEAMMADMMSGAGAVEDGEDEWREVDDIGSMAWSIVADGRGGEEEEWLRGGGRGGGGGGTLDPASSSGRSSSSTTTSSSPSASFSLSLFSASSAPLGANVARLRDGWDSALKEILEDTVFLLVRDGAEERGGVGGGGGVGAVGGGGSELGERVNALAPFLRERCFESAKGIVRELQERLDRLSASMENLGGGGEEGESDEEKRERASRLVERALFIGRLCSGLGKFSVYLPLILGPTMEWWMVGIHGQQQQQQQQQQRRRAAAPGRRILGAAGRWRDTDGGGGGGGGGSSMMLEDGRLWWSGKSKSDSGAWAGGGGGEAAAAGGRGGGEGEGGDLSQKLKELRRSFRRVSISAYCIWVTWSADQLAMRLEIGLRNEEALSTTARLKGWEETVVKQEEEGAETVEMRMSLPGMPSSYALSFLFTGCREIHRVGGHTLDRAVLRHFAWKLCEKVLTTFEKMLSDKQFMDEHVSEKGLLQLLFDLRFLADVLSGGMDMSSGASMSSLDEADGLGVNNLASFVGVKRTRLSVQSDPAVNARKKQVAALLTQLQARLDPIDWATYEEHLWQNKRNYYNRCAVLFGSFIQLNRLYTDSPHMQGYNGDTNTLNMSATVPRFTYLPISAPVLPGDSGSALRRKVGMQDRSWSQPEAWKVSETNGDASVYDFSEIQPSIMASSGAKVVFKSFMGQVGSRFGEGTFRLGSMLGDGQVSRLKDKSAAAISSFGDMLPATGIFSSLANAAK